MINKIEKIFIVFILMFSPIAFAGYDVHITQKIHWVDNNDICIDKVTWGKYLETDSSIKVDNENRKGSYLVHINGNEYSIWFDYNGCNLETKDPNSELLGKLIKIARVLNAKVQGDDGEIYITPEEFYEPED